MPQLPFSGKEKSHPLPRKTPHNKHEWPDIPGTSIDAENTGSLSEVLDARPMVGGGSRQDYQANYK